MDPGMQFRRFTKPISLQPPQFYTRSRSPLVCRNLPSLTFSGFLASLFFVQMSTVKSTCEYSGGGKGGGRGEGKSIPRFRNHFALFGTVYIFQTNVSPFWK